MPSISEHSKPLTRQASAVLRHTSFRLCNFLSDYVLFWGKYWLLQCIAPPSLVSIVRPLAVESVWQHPRSACPFSTGHLSIFFSSYKCIKSSIMTFLVPRTRTLRTLRIWSLHFLIRCFQSGNIRVGIVIPGTSLTTLTKMKPLWGIKITLSSRLGRFWNCSK